MLATPAAGPSPSRWRPNSKRSKGPGETPALLLGEQNRIGDLPALINTLSITGQIRRLSQLYDRLFFWLTQGFTVVGPILFGVGTAYITADKNLAALWLSVGVCVTLVALYINSRIKIGSFEILAETVNLQSEAKDAQLAAKDTEQRAERQCRELQDQNTVLENDIRLQHEQSKRWQEQYESASADMQLRATFRAFMRIAYEDLHNAAAAMPLETPLEVVLESMGDTAYQNIVSGLGCHHIPMDMELDEFWTFSIFSCETQEDGKNSMVRRFARSHDRREERDNRIWLKGEGYTGYAWEHDQTVVVENSQLAEELARFHVPKDKFQQDDLGRYISIVSVPIRISDDSGQSMICGVITATSNRPGCFLADLQHPKAQNVLFIEQVERIISLQIQHRYALRGKIFTTG